LIPELLRTYEKLGFLLIEQTKCWAGIAVDAVFDFSLSVKPLFGGKLEERAFIFLSDFELYKIP